MKAKEFLEMLLSKETNRTLSHGPLELTSTTTRFK